MHIEETDKNKKESKTKFNVKIMKLEFLRSKHMDVASFRKAWNETHGEDEQISNGWASKHMKGWAREKEEWLEEEFKEKKRRLRYKYPIDVEGLFKAKQDLVKVLLHKFYAGVETQEVVDELGRKVVKIKKVTHTFQELKNLAEQIAYFLGESKEFADRLLDKEGINDDAPDFFKSNIVLKVSPEFKELAERLYPQVNKNNAKQKDKADKNG